MKNQEIKNFSKIVIFVSVTIVVVTFAVFIILRMYSWALGFILGSLTSYITYLMHVNNVNNLSENTVSPRKHAIKSSLMRLLISAIPLALSLFFGWLNIFATFIGLLTNKIAIVIAAIIYGVKDKKIIEGGID